MCPNHHVHSAPSSKTDPLHHQHVHAPPTSNVAFTVTFTPPGSPTPSSTSIRKQHHLVFFVIVTQQLGMAGSALSTATVDSLASTRCLQPSAINPPPPFSTVRCRQVTALRSPLMTTTDDNDR
jgi:hypothetical protein